MERFIYIGKYKKPLNKNYDDKCPYLKNLFQKRENEYQNIEKIKNEIINDKILNEDELFQRDYAFFSVLKPGYKEINKLPKIKIYPGFKYYFKSPVEKYKSYNITKKNELDKLNKKNLIYFPRAVKAYHMKRSKSEVYLPKIKNKNKYIFQF